jgi:hypothetical protein
MSNAIRRVLSAVICAASSTAVALIASVTASADPAVPTPPPPPPAANVQTAAAPAAGPSAPLNDASASVPAADAAGQTAAGQLPTPPDGVPHLASPDALPPGSTMDPSVMAGESPNVSYLKDLWHAVQNQEISGKEALLLGVAQRGMNTPIPPQAPGPNVPISPSSATDPALAPAPPAPGLPAPALPASPPPPASPLPPTP